MLISLNLFFHSVFTVLESEGWVTEVKKGCYQLSKAKADIRATFGGLTKKEQIQANQQIEIKILLGELASLIEEGRARVPDWPAIEDTIKRILDIDPSNRDLRDIIEREAIKDNLSTNLRDLFEV